eukprot:2210622-Amphidinium_carterae.1
MQHIAADIMSRTPRVWITVHQSDFRICTQKVLQGCCLKYLGKSAARRWRESRKTHNQQDKARADEKAGIKMDTPEKPQTTPKERAPIAEHRLFWSNFSPKRCTPSAARRRVEGQNIGISQLKRRHDTRAIPNEYHGLPPLYLAPPFPPTPRRWGRPRKDRAIDPARGGGG